MQSKERIGLLTDGMARQVVRFSNGKGVLAGQGALLNRGNKGGDITLGSVNQVEMFLVGEPVASLPPYVTASNPPYIHQARRYIRSYNMSGTRIDKIGTDTIYSMFPLVVGSYVHCVWCAGHWEPLMSVMEVQPSASISPDVSPSIVGCEVCGDYLTVTFAGIESCGESPDFNGTYVLTRQSSTSIYWVYEDSVVRVEAFSPSLNGQWQVVGHWKGETYPRDIFYSTGNGSSGFICSNNSDSPYANQVTECVFDQGGYVQVRAGKNGTCVLECGGTPSQSFGCACPTGVNTTVTLDISGVTICEDAADINGSHVLPWTGSSFHLADGLINYEVSIVDEKLVPRVYKRIDITNYNYFTVADGGCSGESLANTVTTCADGTGYGGSAVVTCGGSISPSVSPSPSIHDCVPVSTGPSGADWLPLYVCLDGVSYPLVGSYTDPTFGATVLYGEGIGIGSQLEFVLSSSSWVLDSNPVSGISCGSCPSTSPSVSPSAPSGCIPTSAGVPASVTYAGLTYGYDSDTGTGWQYYSPDANPPDTPFFVVWDYIDGRWENGIGTPLPAGTVTC